MLALYPWLTTTMAGLSQALLAERLHHGILLQGPRGLGKRHLARWLTVGLLCDQQPGLQACGECKNCRLGSTDTHPDCLIIDDISQSVGIDEIRRSSQFLYQTSQFSGRRLLLINHSEQMTPAAANGLLKTLEEPCANAYLILCCDDPSYLPATIRSRCLKVTVNCTDPHSALAFLRQQYPQLTQAQFELLFKLAAQAPLQVLDWLGQDKLALVSTLADAFQQWLTGQMSTFHYHQLLSKTDFARLLFYHLLVDHLRQLRTTANQRLTLSQIDGLFALLSQFSLAQRQVLGQNKDVALLSLLTQCQQMLDR